MLNFKFLKFAPVLFVLAFVLFSHNVSLAQEQEDGTEILTKIGVKEVKIEKSGAEIKISAILFNPSENVATPEVANLLILRTIDPLIKPKDDRILLPSLIVAADEGKDYFSLKPNEERFFSYILSVSPYIPQANYGVYLGFIRPNGQVEASYNGAIENFGSSQKEGFLAFDEESCVLLNKEGKKFGNNDGPTFLPGESPEARCLIKNIGGKEIEASPKILWKEVYVYGKPLDGTMAVETPGQKIFFKAGETKLVSIFMPKAEKPQVYQSLLSFEDKDGESRSFNMFFRWTIAGESARIKNVAQISPLKDSYAKGEKVALSVDYFGSADLFWAGTGQDVSNLGNLIMKAVIKDGDGNICGEKEEIIADITDANLKNKIIAISLDKKCKDMSYDISLASNQKSLAEESGELPKIVKKEGLSAANYIFVILFIVAATLVFYFLRRGKKTAIAGLLFIFSLVAFFAATSAVQASGCDGDNCEGSSYSYQGGYGGKWSGNSDKLYSYWGGENWSNINVFKAKKVDAYFDTYFSQDSDQSWKNNAMVFLDYVADDGACSNSSMVVSIKMSIRAKDLPETSVRFRIDRSDTWRYEVQMPYNNSSGATEYKDFNIKEDWMKKFYYKENGQWKLRANPVLFVEFRQAGVYNSAIYYAAGWSNTSLNQTPYTLDTALNNSKVIRVKIPLNLPDPSLDLTGPSSAVDYNCKPTLSWTVNDVDSCSASGGWSGSKSDSNGTHSEAMASGIIVSTDYGLSCSANLGTGVGTGTYSDSVTVGVNARPTADLKANGSDYDIKVNPSSSVALTWTRSSGWSSCDLKSYDGSSITTIVSNAGVTGNANVTMGSADGSYKTFSLSCSNSCGYNSVDGQKATVDVKPLAEKCSLTINKDAAGGNGSVNVLRSAGTSFVCNLQSGYSSCNSTSESLGDTLTLTPNPSIGATWPSGCSSQSAGNCVVNLPSSGTCNKSVTVKFPITPAVPSGFSAGPACKAVNLTWDIDEKGGEYNDPVGNTGSQVVKYYEIVRTNDNLTITKSDNINRWDNANKKFVDNSNSYTDSSMSDLTKTYSYKIRACNDDNLCSAYTDEESAQPQTSCGGGGGGGGGGGNPPTVNGACGTATTRGWASAPTTNLCVDNSTPAVSGGNGSSWTWTCSGSSSNASCSASYDPGAVNLTLDKTGSGTGNVKLYGWRATPWNDYGETTDNDFTDGETKGLAKDWWFKMTAASDSGSNFGGWSGCSSTDPKGVESYSDRTCFVTMDASKTATVTFDSDVCVGCGAVTASISADKTTTNENEARTITWDSDGATSCTPSGGDSKWVDTLRSDYNATEGTYTKDPFGNSDRTYTIECTNGSETADDSVTIRVSTETDPASVDFWAYPNPINSGETTELKWLSSNANSCYLFQSYNGEFFQGGIYGNVKGHGQGFYFSVPKIGSKETVKLYNASETVAKVYPRIICTSPVGDADKPTTIEINPPVSDFTFTNTTGAMTATIVEGLSANSSSATLAFSGTAIGNVILSASVPSKFGSGAKAQFSADNGVNWSETLSIADISATPQVKLKVIDIPGTTAIGTYTVSITAKDDKRTVLPKPNINLQVKKVSSEWQEF